MIKNTITWLIGFFLILGGMFELEEGSILAGILILSSAALTLPPIFEKIQSKKNIDRGIRFIAAFVLFVSGVMLSPAPKNNNAEVITLEEPTQTSNVLTEENQIENNTGTVVKVADGDTLTVRVNDKDLKVRLIGIDTPELSHPSEPVQCYAVEAKNALENLVLNKEVQLDKDVSETDKYDRYLRYIWLGETFVNEYMVQNGYAFASDYPPDVKYSERLAAAEQQARHTDAGLWAENTCKGDVYTGTYKDPQAQPSSQTETPTAYIVQEPKPASAYVPAPQNSVGTPAPAQQQSPYTCSCNKTCGQMASCEEAYYQLNSCGCSARDGDKDGVPCESICR